MYKYVAFVWNKQNRQAAHEFKRIVRHLQRASASEWRCVLEQSGLVVYQSGNRRLGPRDHLLYGSRGVVLGSLFYSSDTEVADSIVSDFDDSEARKIVRSGGRLLVSDYWGSYVAFLYDKDRDRHFVFRDPSAALPCFTLKYQDIDLYFSWMPDLAECEDLPMTINWRYVAGHLLHDQLRISETGLNEVREVLAGQCVEHVDGRRTTQFYWDPRTFAQQDSYEDAAEASQTLYTRARACVRTWSSCYRKIIMELSGGLDSAIVLGCLADAPDGVEIICQNIYTPHPDGDERYYARLAAERAGCELLESTRPLSDADIGRALTSPRFASPSPYVLSSSFDDIYSQMARKHGADAYFAGQGGDHLFHEAKVNLIAADYLARHGFGKQFLHAVHTTAFFTKQSFWRVLGEALSADWLGKSVPLYAPLQDNKKFLSPDALLLVQDDYLLHPWLKSAEGVAPAKFRQIRGLVDLQSYYWPAGRAEFADIVYPLLSQPIIELCLRIPTYVLTVGGRDRGLARRAFANDVPPEIIARQTKGSIGSYFTRMLSRNADTIRELLLDGELASAGMIADDEIEARLRTSKLDRGDEFMLILEYISMEAWLRSWRHQRTRAIA